MNVLERGAQCTISPSPRSLTSSSSSNLLVQRSRRSYKDVLQTLLSSNSYPKRIADSQQQKAREENGDSQDVISFDGKFDLDKYLRERKAGNVVTRVVVYRVIRRPC